MNDDSRQPVSTGRQRTVLVLEDEPTLLELVKEVLELEGMHVTATGNTEGAAKHLRETKFDLFLTDIVVNGEFSGGPLARQARRLGQATNVVVMSGHPKQRALAGDDDDTTPLNFLKKPFSFEELIEACKAPLAD